MFIDSFIPVFHYFFQIVFFGELFHTALIQTTRFVFSSLFLFISTEVRWIYTPPPPHKIFRKNFTYSVLGSCFYNRFKWGMLRININIIKITTSFLTGIA